MTVEEGEAWGTWEAMFWARALGFNSVVVEVDAKMITDAVRKEAKVDTPFGNYVEMIKEFLRNNHSFSINLVRRNANCVAHAFAKNSRFFENPNIWVEPPIFVDGLLESFCSSCD